MALPGVRTAATAEQAARLAKRDCLPSVHERASIYLLLVEVIGKLNKGQETPEAKKVRPYQCQCSSSTVSQHLVAFLHCSMRISSCLL
jgi:tetratricopeptide repeat protein 21B